MAETDLDGAPQCPLRLGMFLMPASRPDTPLSNVIDWYLEVIREADALGYSEMWVGTHMTSKYERITAPQQIIARALGETKSITFGTGVEILYQQHPVTLALQLAQLDHMAQGRLLFGFGAGATTTDHQIYGIDFPTSQAMTREALDIVLNVWKDGGPTEFRGEYWSVFPSDSIAAYGEDRTHGWHIQTYAEPSHRIALAGFGQKSPSLRQAGARGYIPMSLNISHDYLADQWAVIEEGARSTGRQANRRRWRQAKEIYVAETMAEARRGAVNGFLGDYWREYAPSYYAKKPGVLDLFRRADADPNADVTPEYLVDNGVWFVGDPDTVARQIREQFEASGGFGTLLQIGMDY
ncbi:LLM class flavin-dependent oxidoreductase, partial [Pseudorhodoplanes sp.]|uniref:LLM class flavin-dependent oxidoreductase n=1 Tax=Pseudorhodoplanes sp. TaxID=1934341 RepID=UPI003D0F9694